MVKIKERATGRQKDRSIPFFLEYRYFQCKGIVSMSCTLDFSEDVYTNATFVLGNITAQNKQTKFNWLSFTTLCMPMRTCWL